MASKVLQHRVTDADAENVEPSDSIVGLPPNKRSLPAGSKLRCAPPSKRKALQKLENNMKLLSLKDPKTQICSTPAILKNEEIFDIDNADDSRDPCLVSEYAFEIMDYCATKQLSDRVDPQYLEKQHSICEKEREVVVDWLAEVSVKFKLVSETFFLAVYIVDKYLSSVSSTLKRDLQLLAATAVLIASKFEEVYAVELSDLVYLCNGIYSVKQFVMSERQVLNILGFTLDVPSPLVFLRRFSRASRADSYMHTYSKYLTEMSTMEYSLLRLLPSEIAAAAVYLSRRVTHQKQNWVCRSSIPNLLVQTSTLQFYTKYSEEEIIPIARMLLAAVKKYSACTKYKAIKEKYSASTLLEVGKRALCADF